MENATKTEMTEKKQCCCCGALLGALVIVFAWVKVSWGAIALTVLGILVILKNMTPCICQKMCCKSGNPK